MYFLVVIPYRNTTKQKQQMGNIKPNNQRAKNAILLIWIVLTFEIIALISSYFKYVLLQIVANGGQISTKAATAVDMRELIISILYLIAYIISAVTFIQWFRRAYYNLHLKISYLSQTEGWAAGSWFVPIVNLYRPFQIMLEMYQETKGLLTKKGIGVHHTFSTTMLGWWWTLWIINNIIGQFVFRYSMKAESIDELTTSTMASMIGNILGIPLALITIKVIKDYSNVEPLLNEINDDEESSLVADSITLKQ